MSVQITIAICLNQEISEIEVISDGDLFISIAIIGRSRLNSPVIARADCWSTSV